MNEQTAVEVRIICPACKRYLGTVQAVYFEAPPCQCGWQTTVRAVGRRAVLSAKPLRVIETK